MVEVSKCKFINRHSESENILHNKTKGHCLIDLSNRSTFLGHPVDRLKTCKTEQKCHKEG